MCRKLHYDIQHNYTRGISGWAKQCKLGHIGVAMLVLVNCNRKFYADDGKQLYPCYCTIFVI